MIPILYKADETDFSTLGLGLLNDEIETLVTEERNGQFFLEMSYPISGNNFEEIKVDRLIKVDAGNNLKDQRFKIVRISKPAKGVVYVYAEHISYHTADLQLKKGAKYNGNASQALTNWSNNMVDDHPFTTYSDITTTGEGEWSVEEVENARHALGGVRGSILDTYGGEYRFDNYRISLLKERGADNNIPIMYGKNLTDLNQEEEISNTYTSIYPYAVYSDEDGSDPVTITLPEHYIDSEHVDKYARRKILKVDFSRDEISTVEQLRSRTERYIRDNNVGVPNVNLKVKFIDLIKTIDYKDRALVEEINLCDYVVVHFEKLGITQRAKVIKTVWNVTLEHYEEIEIGEVRSSLSQTINKTIDEKIGVVNNRVNIVQVAANGKNRIFRGKDEPTVGMQEKDLWYKPVGDGETELYTYNGNMWVLEKVSAGLLGGTLDAENGDVNLINVNVASIVGETSSFVQSWWNGISDSTFIDSSGISLNRTDGSRSAHLGVNGYEFWLEGKEHGTMGVRGSLPEHTLYPKKSVSLYARSDSFVSLSYQGSSTDGRGFGALTVDGETGNVRISRPLNMAGNPVSDALNFRTKNDIYESIFRTWSDGESFVGGTNGARLGYIDGTTYQSRLWLPKSGPARLFSNLSMENYYISNISTVYTGDARVENNLYVGSGGSLYQSTTNDPHTGHKPLVIDANGTLGLSVNGYQHFRTFRYSSGSSGTHFFTDINMQGYTISNQSDVRLKTKIKKANVDALKEIDRLEFIYYEWDREKKPEYPEGVQFGIKAQYSPFLQRKDAREDSYLSIDMNKHVNLNSKAIQELLRRVELLEGGNSDD